MALSDWLFGRRLATLEEENQRVGVLAGIPMLGLDALASAAYGPEAALTLLIPLGIGGVRYIGPITTLIIALLAVVYFSYRQTIAAYPHGGGSYTVAKENLGTGAGLLAAAALLLDYVLVVAVGVSAGVGALVSALPVLQPYTLTLCLVTLAMITIVNLRGVRESGRGVHRADVPVRRLAPGRACRRDRQDGHDGRPPGAGGPAAGAPLGRDGGALLAPDAVLRQRLHGDDGRRGGQQRRQCLPRAVGPLRPSHPDGDHRAPGHPAGRHRLPVPGLWRRRHRAGRARIRQRVVAARRRRRRQGRDLLRHDRVGAGRAGALGQHRLRRFPAALPGHRAGRLPAQRVRPPGPTARLLARHPRAGGPLGRLAGHLPRDHRQPHPAVRGRCVPGLHALAGRHGRALAQDRRPGGPPIDDDQRPRCGLHGE